MSTPIVHEIVNGDNCAIFSVAGNTLRIKGLRLRVEGQTRRHIDLSVTCSSCVTDSFDEVAMAVFGNPYEFDGAKTAASHLDRIVRCRKAGIMTALQARACWEIIQGWALDEFSSVEEFDDLWLNIGDPLADLMDDGMDLSDADIFEVQAFFGEYSVVVNFCEACETFRSLLWDPFLLNLNENECSTKTH